MKFKDLKKRVTLVTTTQQQSKIFERFQYKPFWLVLAALITLLIIASLRTAVDNDGLLDKQAISYNDIFDAFRLELKFYCTFFY